MVEVDPPSERACERCGRRETWDAEVATWTVAGEGADVQRGSAHCLHEWDINGTYNPLTE
jgi:hypothetical protein